MPIDHQAEIFLPRNAKTQSKIRRFISAIFILFGDCSHSKYQDVMGDHINLLVTILNDDLDMSLPRLEGVILPYTGYYTPKEPGSVRMMEEAILIKIGFEKDASDTFLRNLRILHGNIIGYGETESWIIYYPITRVS